MSTRTLKRRVTATAALSLGVVVAGVVGAASCEVLPECVVDDDCSFGQLCLDTRCAARPGLNPIGGGNIGGGGGGGGGGDPDDPAGNDSIDDRSPVEVSGTLTAFRNDDLGPLSLLLPETIGRYQVGLQDAGRDEVLFFDPAFNGDPLDVSQTSTDQRITFIDGFIVGADDTTPTCGFDRIVIQNNFQPVSDGPEAWLACRDQPFLLQVRGPDPTQLIVRGHSRYVDFNVPFGVDADNGSIEGRRAYAGRGDATLVVERKADVDVETAIRGTDEIDADFGAIAGIFPVFERRNGEDPVGDMIAVFDRFSPLADNAPALVLLERQSVASGDPDSWDVAEIDGQQQVLKLPADTHAVLFSGLEDPRSLAISTAAAETVNLTVFRPTAGRVQFARYEQVMSSSLGVLDPLDESFLPVRFDTSVIKTTTIPSPNDRILLLDVDGSEADVNSQEVFYVMTDVQAGWLLPLRQKVDQQVDDSDIRAADFADATPGNAIGLLPVPGQRRSAWIGIDAGVRGQLVHVLFRN